MNVLGICGSLRQASTNAMALRAAQKLAPAGMKIDIADISRIPLYNDDVRAAGEPAEVAALKAKVRAADALLIATPEYNFSIPGVLKNTLDWLSRPDGREDKRAAFRGKPVGLLSASPGYFGGVRHLVHLGVILQNLEMLVLPEPFGLAKAGNAFATDGTLKEPAALAAINELAQRVVDTTRALRHLRA